MQRRLAGWLLLFGLGALGVWLCFRQSPEPPHESDSHVELETSVRTPDSITVDQETLPEPLRRRVEDDPIPDLPDHNSMMQPVELGPIELRIRVVDPSDVPRAGVYVVTQLLQDPPMYMDVRRFGVTDDNGEIRREVKPGKRIVFTSHDFKDPGWISARQVLDLRGNASIELTMYPQTAALDVLVVDDVHEPLAGILLSTGQGFDSVTDQAGRARIENQPAGMAVSVRAVHKPERLRVTLNRTQPQRLVAGDNPATLQLERQSHLVMELSEDLRDSLGAADEVVITAHAIHTNEVRLTRNKPRRERWLAAGTHEFLLRAKVGVAGTVLQLAPGTTTHWILEPMVGTQVLKGRAVDPEGQAVQGITVTLWFPEFLLAKSEVTAIDGTFDFRDLPATTDARLGYQPAFGSEWRHQGDGGLETSRRRIEVPSPLPVTIKLKRGFSIEGQIKRNGTRIADDRECPKIEIDWAHTHDQPSTAEASKGRYRFTNLRPGTYRIRWTGQTEWQHTVAFDADTSEPVLTLDLDVD